MKTQQIHATYPKTVRCKDGHEVLLRPMQAGDLDAVRAFFGSLPRADRLFLRYDVTDASVFESWLPQLDNPRLLRLLAFRGDRVVGHALLEPERHNWSPHVAEARVVIAEDVKRHSLGTLLLRELVDQASVRNYDKLSTHMMDSQVAARKMCERAGFAVEAELKNHVRDLDGHKHNLIIMCCNLDEAWHKMELLLEDFAPWAG
ncbi:MAG: GNAT family N-acetyltransferase [Myxococcales bacterium]|jgi:L-amino acid N-acyltransferase YncA